MCVCVFTYLCVCVCGWVEGWTREEKKETEEEEEEHWAVIESKLLAEAPQRLLG